MARFTRTAPQMVLPKLFSRKNSNDLGTSPLPSRRASTSPEKKTNRPPPPSHERSSKANLPSRKKKSASKQEHETHPLNLPPEELRRRLSDWSRSSGSQRTVTGDMEQNRSSSPSSPVGAAPGAFPQTNGSQPESKTNGQANGQTNGINGDSHEGAPTPPPHKSSPPPETPEVDAEACKAAGNKFFKAREWQKAIQEYSKGAREHSPARKFG